MMNGGRILHHAKRYLSSSKNSLLIIGYQAKGTLGRRLFDKEPQVKIFGKNIPVNAKIRAIGSYSAHADSPQIIEWISKVQSFLTFFLKNAARHLEATAIGKDNPLEIHKLV